MVIEALAAAEGDLGPYVVEVCLPVWSQNLV